MATSIQSLSARIDEGEGAPLVASVLPSPPSSLRSLDLDLSESANISEISPSGVESDSNFFSQFDSIAPMALPVFLPTPGSLARPSLDVDNLIDFDPFDSSGKASQRILPTA